MATLFEVAVPGATIVGERHDIGDHWSPNVDKDAGKLPLILLHAWVADRRSWHRVIPTWSTNRTVITYDQRGFGDTTHEACDHDLVADLLAVMDAQGIERAILVGNSMGGAVAIHAALDHPDRVGALVLIGSAITGAPPADLDAIDPAVLAADEAIDAAEEAGDLDLANHLGLAFWLDGATSPPNRADPAARELFLDMNGRALRHGFTGSAGPHTEAWPRLAELAMPVLSLLGEYDLPSVAERSGHLVRTAPAAQEAQIDRTGHLPALDAHLRTLSACAGFLEQVD